MQVLFIFYFDFFVKEGFSFVTHISTFRDDTIPEGLIYLNA